MPKNLFNYKNQNEKKQLCITTSACTVVANDNLVNLIDGHFLDYRLLLWLCDILDHRLLLWLRDILNHS